jgi:hypothetical protein
MVLTYLLTPRCRVIPEQLTGLQLVKKFPRISRNSKVHHRTHKRPPPVLLRDASPANPPLPGNPSGWSSLPPDCFVSRASIPHVSVS